MDPKDTTKMIQITGIKKRQRSRRKGKQTGGSFQSDVIISKFPDAMAPQSDSCPPSWKGYQAPTIDHGAPLSMAFKPVMPNVPESAVTAAGARPPAGPIQSGGDSRGDSRGILIKPADAKRVQLVPKKAHSEAKAGAVTKKKKTRRIILGLVSLKKRQTRANKINTKVKEMPLDLLKKHLIEKNLIKPSSKAPESVLRQIAADAQIVSGKGL